MTERTPLEFSQRQAGRRKGNTAGDGEKQRVTLPPGVLAQIKSITSDASLAPHRRLEAAILLTWGWAWYERQVTVDPTMIALPETQWQEICEYLVSGVPDDKINQVNLGLSWTNSGPSGYSD
jgi:hypothetical protein